jgi:hypothetical protein
MVRAVMNSRTPGQRFADGTSGSGFCLTVAVGHERLAHVKSCGPSGSQDLAFVGPKSASERFPVAQRFGQRLVVAGEELA